MTRVDQTIIDPGKGNCMQAVVASLFDLKLDDVPDFNKFQPEHYKVLWEFYEARGLYPGWFDRSTPAGNLQRPSLAEIAKYDGGIGGFFYAGVQSQTYKDKNIKHAVVVDTDLNIVHDPNPNRLALQLKPKDVELIIVVTDFTIQDNKFIK